MRKNVVLLLFCLPLLAAAQVDLNISAVATSRIGSNINKGDSLTLKKVRNDATWGSVRIGLLNQEGQYLETPYINLAKLKLYAQALEEYWQKVALEEGVYKDIVRIGRQLSLRRSLAEEALDYLHCLKAEGLIYEDLFLETYLSKLANRVYPASMNRIKEEPVQVKIVKDRVPHLELYPGGLFFISTGMLSALHSETELIALMSTEVVHRMLDHAVRNINKEVQRQPRAEFWDGLATVAATSAQSYGATQDGRYLPGALTGGVTEISTNVAYQVNNRLGIIYRPIQRVKADRYAVGYLKFFGLEKTHLSAAFENIQGYLKRMNRQDLVLADDRTERLTWDERQAYLSLDTTQVADPKYDQYMATVHEFNARLAHHNGDWATTNALISRNLAAGYETAEAYQMMALPLMHRYEEEAKQKEALRLIERGLRVNQQAYYLYKLQGTIFLQLDAKESARAALEQYRKGLDLNQKRLPDIQNSEEWSYLNNFLQREYRWIQEMLRRAG